MSDITASLILDDSQYSSKIAAATTAATKLGSSLHGAGKDGKEALDHMAESAEQLKSRMEGLAAILVGGEMIEFVKGAMESTAVIGDLADMVGVSTQAMMDFRLAGLASGRSAEDMANMMQKLNLAAQNAAEGNLKTRDSLNALGLTNEYLRTHTLEEAFTKAVKGLAAMDDHAKRASMTMEILGKGGLKTGLQGLAGDLDTFKGASVGTASAVEAAKVVMDRLEVATQQVKDQFVLLLKPILDFGGALGVGGDQMTAGATKAKILAVAMAGIAAGSVMVTLNAMKTAFTGLFGATAAAAAGTNAETQANAANTASMAANATVRQAGLAAKVASMQASIAAAQATISEGVAGAELAAAQNVLQTTTWRLTIAQAALAATTAEVAAAEGILVGSAVVLAGGEGIATAATWTLSGAMKGLMTSTAAALGPIGAITAAVTSWYAVYQATFGKEHGMFSDTGDQSGANWISDLIGTTNSQLDELNAKIAKTKEEGKPAEGSTPVIAAKEVDINAPALQGLRNQISAMSEVNNRAVKRLDLEKQLTSEGNVNATSMLAAFDAETKKRSEHERIMGQIKMLQIEISNAEKLGGPEAGTKIKNLGSQIGLLKQQDALQQGQVDKIQKGTAALVAAQNIQKVKMYYTDLDNKLLSDKADLQDAINQITMTGNEKALDAINKQIRAAVDGAIKLKAVQLGRNLTDEEKGDITKTVTTKFAPIVSGQGELNTATEAGKKRVFYEEQAFKIAANIRDLKMSTDELTMTNDEIKMNSIRRAAQTEIDTYVKMRSESIGLKAAEDERASVTQRILDAHLSEAQAMQQLIDKSREFSTGWDKAWKDYSDAANNASLRAVDMFNTFSNAFESAFDQMVRTGKVSWNSLLQDMVASMMKSDVKRMFADLMTPTAGGKSNIFSSIGSLFHASGGDIPAGQMGIVGEVRPETVMGPARVGPSTGGGAAQNITYNISAVDAKSFQQLVASDPTFIHAVVMRGQRAMPGA